ncbi:hypothetical protein BH11PLA2_BH11PLA2_37940 [soil metagenome]
MNFLALEISYETVATVFTDDLRILSNVVASQNELYAAFAVAVAEGTDLQGKDAGRRSHASLI